jgi:hypothetical protein
MLMDGSLAVWCDTAPKQVVGLEPRLDLHLNLWVELGKGIPSVLDVGILLKESRQIESLNIYFPVEVLLADIHDLSGVLRDDSTLSAVFNSTFYVGDQRGGSFDVRNANHQVEFRVVRFDINHDIEVENLDNRHGTVIKFTKSLFGSINKYEDHHYIRFRVPLNGKLKNLFQDSSRPPDSGLLSGVHRTDVIEMRVNERRNFNDALRNLNPKFPIIETIQYFLVRDIKTELTQQHAPLRKLRRLEPLLWNNYLKELGKINAEDCIIYHWKTEKNAEQGVENFVALAFFQSPRYHIFQYIIVIFILGAIGASIQSCLTLLFRHWKGSSAEDSYDTQFIVTGVLTVALALTWLTSADVPNALSRMRSRVRGISFLRKL